MGGVLVWLAWHGFGVGELPEMRVAGLRSGIPSGLWRDMFLSGG